MIIFIMNNCLRHWLSPPESFVGRRTLLKAEFHIWKFLNRFLKFFPKNQDTDKKKIYFIGWFSAQILPANLFWDGIIIFNISLCIRCYLWRDINITHQGVRVSALIWNDLGRDKRLNKAHKANNATS